MNLIGIPTVQRLRNYCRLQPLDADHAEARARERHRRATMTGATAVVARVVAIGTSVVTVPITLSYLGPERFGLWMAISSILAVLSFADFGIGNGVMNTVADAHGKNDTDGVRAAISSGIVILSAIAAVLITVFLVVYRIVDWPALFNVRSPIGKLEAGPAVMVFAICFAFNIPVGLVLRAQMGIQEGFRSYLWQLVGSLAGLGAVLVVVHYRRGLPWLLLALSGAPIAVAFINGVVFFGRSHRNLMPSFRCISRAAVRSICRLGGLFFVLQLACALAFSSDNFIIARMLTPELATQYAVPQRMFLMISVILAMLTAPLWPAYAEAISRGDTIWVRRTLVRSLKLVMLAATAGAATLAVFGRGIIHLWVGGTITPTDALLVGFAVWTLFDVAGNAVAMFLNGASVIRYQVIISIIFGTVCVFAKLYSVRHFGIAALPWATTLSYLLTVALPAVFFVPRLVRRIHAPAGSMNDATMNTAQVQYTTVSS